MASPSERVIDAVATATGTEPTDLEPLFVAIDPDSLDALFEPTPYNESVRGSVSFDWAGCHVEVSSDGRVDVEVEERGSEATGPDVIGTD